MGLRLWCHYVVQAIFSLAYLVLVDLHLILAGSCLVLAGLRPIITSWLLSYHDLSVSLVMLLDLCFIDLQSYVSLAVRVYLW